MRNGDYKEHDVNCGQQKTHLNDKKVQRHEFTEILKHE
jgi:hypothetical protein